MTAEDWVSLVGYRRANRLFLEYGGHSIHVPKFPRPEHPLAVLLGYDRLCMLSDLYPSELLWVPRMNAVLEDFKKAMGLPATTRYKRGVWACPNQKSLL